MQVRKGRDARRWAVGAVVAGAILCALVPFAFAASDRTVATRTIDLSPSVQSNTSAACKKGTHATGAGFDIDTAPQAADSIRVVNIFPTKRARRWYQVFDNLSSSPTGDQAATVYTLCRDGGAPDTVVKKQDIDGGSEQFPDLSAKCPKGSSVTGGGLFFAADYNGFSILSSRPTSSRTWTVTPFIPAVVSGESFTYAICDSKHDYEQVEDIQSPPGKKRGTAIEITAAAKCPKGTSTSSGGWEIGVHDDFNSPVLSSRPEGQRTWTSSINTANGAQSVTSTAICRS